MAAAAAEEELARDAAAANVLSSWLALRNVDSLSAGGAFDLCVLCGSGVLATAYVAQQALAEGIVPRVLISGGSGHSTIHLYEAVRRHPLWGAGIATHEGRHEAEVLRDLLLALGAAPLQILPLEVESLHCGGNARCSAELAIKLGLKPARVLMLQDPAMQRRTAATFARWWGQLLPGTEVVSFAPLLPQVRVAAGGEGGGAEADAAHASSSSIAPGLAFVPDSVIMPPPVSSAAQLAAWQQQQQQPTGPDDAQQQQQQQQRQQHVHEREGCWSTDRFLSLLLGEVPRLRDDEGGYGPRGQNFLDHVDVPEEVEAAWGRLAARYPQLLQAR